MKKKNYNYERHIRVCKNCENRIYTNNILEKHEKPICEDCEKEKEQLKSPKLFH